ncbi:MAG: protein phosphatase CheZ [Ignavibacteria bacterium]|nr:protein phosphatase CheZ [Ignavibacteria bacterium]
MKEKSLESFISKVEELRALFVLGQRVIPLLEELFAFVSETQPLLEEINTSIKENLTKMPNLSKQLAKVTEATELATNEILDIIDGVFYKIDIANSNLSQIEKVHSEISTRLANKFSSETTETKFLFTEISGESQKLSNENFFAELKDLSSLLNSTREILDNIRNDASSIMLALQIQDITAQQIAAVNHLLNIVQTRLNVLLAKFPFFTEEKFEQKEDINESNINLLHKKIAFDPDAVDSLSKSTTRQEEIDKLFNESSVETPVISQPLNEDLVPNEIAGALDENSNEAISQEDIDKLFKEEKNNN